MQREEVIEALEKNLKKLKEEEHVEDLMKHGRIDELKQVARELDFSVLDEFFEDEEFLDLKMDEIPQDHEYEMVFYMMYAHRKDSCILAKYQDFTELLKSKKEDLAAKIAELMMEDNLMDYKIDDLLAECNV